MLNMADPNPSVTRILSVISSIVHSHIHPHFSIIIVSARDWIKLWHCNINPKLLILQALVSRESPTVTVSPLSAKFSVCFSTERPKIDDF